MEQGYQPIRFEIAGSSGEDPLGLWTAITDSAVHFGLDDDSAAPPVDTPIYRIQLPEDTAAIESEFHERELRMQQKARLLERIPGRLDDLVAHTQARQNPVEAQTVQFDMEAISFNEGIAETELLNQLSEVDANTAFVRTAASGQLEFGLMDEVINPAIEQAKTQFNALLHQVDCEVLHFAWVETALSGRTLARTSVDWSGDAETVWAGEISTDQILLHYRTFRFATQSRALKLRMAMTVMGGAVKISALMTNPAGAALALPVVYRYVSQVLAQAAQLKTLKEGV